MLLATWVPVRGLVLATWVGYLGACRGPGWPGDGYLGWLLGCPCRAATWVPVRGLVMATWVG